MFEGYRTYSKVCLVLFAALKDDDLAGLAKRRSLTPDTVLRIALLTKQFTATVVVMLVDNGKVRPGDDIAVYLPDDPTRGRKITIAPADPGAEQCDKARVALIPASGSALPEQTRAGGRQ
nr:serine hydrolase domain-containing protein [Telluria antibiotica]